MSQGIRLSIRVDGIERALRSFDNRWKRANDLSEPLDRAADFMLGEIDRNFNGRRGRIWGGWPRRKRSYPWPILEKTGKMRRGFAKKVKSSEAIITNRVKYFKFHQAGTKRMVKRAMWGITHEQSRQIVKEVQKYLVEGER